MDAHHRRSGLAISHEGLIGRCQREQHRRMSDTDAIPTLFDWAGGEAQLTALFQSFYERVREDGTLGPIFAHMDPHHAEKVAEFVGQVFGGPSTYTDGGGSHAAMILRHMGKHLTDDQRKQWIALLLDTADKTGVPADPEFRSALVGYLEWGSRLAVMNSAEGAMPPESGIPMPTWNWGPPGGPWIQK
jgi:hemoglobin